MKFQPDMNLPGGRTEWAGASSSSCPCCLPSAPALLHRVGKVGLPAHSSPRFTPHLAIDRKLMHLHCGLPLRLFLNCFLGFVVLFSSWDVPLPWGCVLPLRWFANKFYFLYVNTQHYIFCSLMSETDQILQISWEFVLGFFFCFNLLTEWVFPHTFLFSV